MEITEKEFVGWQATLATLGRGDLTRLGHLVKQMAHEIMRGNGPAQDGTGHDADRFVARFMDERYPREVRDAAASAAYDEKLSGLLTAINDLLR